MARFRALQVVISLCFIVVFAGFAWEAIKRERARRASDQARQQSAGTGAIPIASTTTNPATPTPTATPSPMHLGRVEVVSPNTPAEASYTTRGRIEGLPEEVFRPGGVIYLQLHHEFIPEFVGPTGKVEGMKEMIMDFPTITPDVSWEGLRVGEPVELTFEVRWKSEPRFILTRLVRLPDDVQLNLSEVVR